MAARTSIDEILEAGYSPANDDDEMEELEDDDIDLTYDEGDDLGEDEGETDHEATPSAPFNPTALGLKEIGSLAHFRVSSYKPGNGVEELINDDTDRFWQSDGIQPHRVTITFVKMVEIRAIRFHVDYRQDESYTPTKISWLAGTAEHNMFPFATTILVNPSGWVDVPITGCGGGEDGNSLMTFVVQMHVVENHQNGKDTHIRGVKVYGFDDQLRAAGATGPVVREDGGGAALFKVADGLTPEEQEEALMAHLRSREAEQMFQQGDASGTASSLDFIEDPVIR